DLDLRREGRLVDHQRVVATRLERRRQPGEHARAVVVDGRRLAVHGFGCADHPGSERCAQRLVPEADAQQRRSFVKYPYQFHEAAGILRTPGAGGEDHALRLRGDELLRGGRVGPDHPSGLARSFDQLDQVVDERVVVVDHQDHRGPPIPAADRIAEAFASVSRYSASGSESCTIPAPDWTCRTPSRATAVRIVMHTSRSPANVRYPTAPA